MASKNGDFDLSAVNALVPAKGVMGADGNTQQKKWEDTSLNAASAVPGMGNTDAMAEKTVSGTGKASGRAVANAGQMKAACSASGGNAKTGAGNGSAQTGKQALENEKADNKKRILKEGLTEEEKAKIKEETGWSDEIVDNIESMDQYEILKNAELQEMEINGRKCLIKKNLDFDYVHGGKSNRERMSDGKKPFDSKTGNPIELHHLGQKADSPLVELNSVEHRTGDYKCGKKNQTRFHERKATEVHGKGSKWDAERTKHWQERSNLTKGG